MAFGDTLHRTLHRFHDRPVPVAPALADLLEMLEGEWVGGAYRDPGEESLYRDHARQVLTDYHRENEGSFRIPAALEFRFTVEVEGVQLSGVIDRMDRIPGGGYEIVDYKTNRRLPPQAQVDRDLQLSVYHLAAKEVWGIEAERLTLYYLLPGQRMTTVRTRQDIDDTRRRIASVAERIGAGQFEPRANPLCDWCDYQVRCPLFRHMYEKIEGDPAPNMTALVGEWIALKRQVRETYRRFDELQPLIHAFCDEHGYRRLYGSDGAAVDRRPMHMTEPDPVAVRAILEPLGLWEEVLAIDPARLSALVESRRLSPAIEDALLASREETRVQHALHLREARERARR